MKRKRTLVCAAGLLSTLFFAGTSNAVPVYLGIDSAQSSVAPAGGPAAPLSGYLRVDVGSLPPNTETVTFDLLQLVANSDGLEIGLDPAFANPGLGVLNAAGSFLIPNLHLSLDAGSGPAPLTLTSILGTFDPGDSCASTFCLDVQFAIQTGPGPADQTIVTVHAVPEPTTLGLLLPALGLATAAGRRRSAPRRGGHRVHAVRADFQRDDLRDDLQEDHSWGAVRCS